MDKIQFFAKYATKAIRNTDEDTTTHTHNTTLVFAAGVFVGSILGPLGLPTAIGAAAGTVLYHEYLAKSSKKNSDS